MVSDTVLGRLYLLAAIIFFDHFLYDAIPHTTFVLGPAASWAMVSFAVFLGLGYSKFKQRSARLPFSFPFLCAHVLCMVALCVARLGEWLDFGALGTAANSFPGQIAAIVTLLLAIALLALACLPLSAWVAAVRTTSPSWLLASVSGVCAFYLRGAFQAFWLGSDDGQGSVLQAITFDAVHAVLKPILPNMVFDPASFVIGTPDFSVFIAKECSGLEGMGMVLIFTAIWLFYFRKENRFPHALFLIPCALASMWLLNIIRISALILIGNGGRPDVAIAGFHSRAGWIAFTLVALAFSIATRKLFWVGELPSPTGGGAISADSRAAVLNGKAAFASESGAVTGESPATGAYLVPFLAILAATFVSKAASGEFEWLYPLRFVGAAVAIWYFRGELKKLNWRFGWAAPVTGAAVFLIWIAPEWWAKGSADAGAGALGSALTALSPAARLTWIAFRVAAASITVPIAEELAFRGYLARRVMGREFDLVPFRNLTLVAIAVSSAVFGLFHGEHWLSGIAAGLAFSAVLKGRGRFGDAVIAHATSNLLLAVWVLARGDWGQW